MKQINKSNLLLISSAILVIATIPLLNFGSFSSALNIWSILNSVSTGEKHVTRLYELILSDNGAGDWVMINIKDNHLTISNGIVVWDNDSSADWQFSSIWWWTQNKIESSNYAWIAWWTSNKIKNWDNSVIWGWNDNTIEWSNAVIAWGESNNAWELWIILWWNNNTASQNGVALWGKWNNAWTNSLVMWSWASWKRAFARNASAEENSARIDAKSGVLIWTTESIPWVSLVVNWAVKIDWNGSRDDNWIAGEIRVVSGCFYAFDWKYRHVISQANNPEDCTWFVSNATCDFWNVRLQQWDQVTWYNAKLSTNCEAKRVVCSGGNLLTLSENALGYDSPYCYDITN